MHIPYIRTLCIVHVVSMRFQKLKGLSCVARAVKQPKAKAKPKAAAPKKRRGSTESAAAGSDPVEPKTEAVEPTPKKRRRKLRK